MKSFKDELQKLRSEALLLNEVLKEARAQLINVSDKSPGSTVGSELSTTYIVHSD